MQLPQFTSGQTVVFKRNGFNMYGSIVDFYPGQCLVRLFNYPPPFPHEWINQDELTVLDKEPLPVEPKKLSFWTRIKSLFN